MHPIPKRPAQQPPLQAAGSRRQLSAVGFDLDGTLVDSLEDIRAALNACLIERSLQALPSALVKGFVGDGAEALIARALAAAADAPPTPASVAATVARFEHHYRRAPARFTRVMPGAQSAVRAARRHGLRVGLCTNKPRAATVALLAALDAAETGIGSSAFDCVVCGDDLPDKKPHPAPLLRLCTQLQIPAESLMFVGDGPQDVLAAKAAGAVSVAVGGGIASAESLEAARAQHRLQSLLELAALLDEYQPTSA